MPRPTAEYWHIGEIAMRLGARRDPISTGLNSNAMESFPVTARLKPMPGGSAREGMPGPRQAERARRRLPAPGNRRVISTPGADELAAQPLERLVDPGAVADPGFDDRGLLHLGFLLGLGGAEDRLHFGERHAQHAVAVAEHEVARLDHHAADGDRNVDLAGAVLVRTAMGDAGGEHGKI